jgi:DNA-binding Lrp family transcriptional regulator
MPRKPDPDTTLRVLKAIRSNPGDSYREIGRRLGLRSPSVVSYHVRKLQEAGLVQRGPYRSHRTLRINSPETCAKKSAAGRKGKGVDALTSKRDPDLQKRIDRVVAKAKRREKKLNKQHSIDVLNSGHAIRFHSSGLKCYKLG